MQCSLPGPDRQESNCYVCGDLENVAAMTFVTIVLVFLAFAIPAAAVWAIAFLVARRSRLKRLMLFVAIYLTLGAWWGYGALILVLAWLPVTLITVWLFEWAAAKDSP